MDCITVEVARRAGESWGIKISGQSPCFVDEVKENSPGDDAGLRHGDVIYNVNGFDVSTEDHAVVAELIAKSGRVVRFKLQPSRETCWKEIEEGLRQMGESWLNDFDDDDDDVQSSVDNSSCEGGENSSGDDDNSSERRVDVKFDHTNYEKYCEMINSDRSPQLTTPVANKVPGEKTFDLRPKYHENVRSRDHNAAIEQTDFIITREDQREFDEKFNIECTFQGKNATVAGAFTGDRNMIFNGNDVTDVRGVHARVRAGIQHFSHAEQQEQIDPADRGKIVIYTTSLGINRSIGYDCHEVRKILKRYRVKFEDRDIFNYPQYKEELYQRLNLKDGDPFPAIPRIYIDGVYVGGAGELRSMCDCGDLRIRLKEFPFFEVLYDLYSRGQKFNIRAACPTCQGSGFVTCHTCQGDAYKKKNRFTQLKCANCRQRGYLDCKECL